MKSRNHFPLFQLCFGVLLLCVFFGWLVVIFELVQRDTEISETRVRVAEERYLQDLVEKFDNILEVELLEEGDLVKRR